MKDYIVADFSGGKDSTAMVLRMIELGEHIDEVVCCDTTKEFPAMYRHIEKVRKVIEDAGIKFTMIKAEHDFDYYMFDHRYTTRNGVTSTGYSWPGTRTRWCTRHLKLDPIKKYFREMSKHHRIIQCNGLAADEGQRLEKTHNQQACYRHPLVEWGWTEADCLRYCYDHGYDWEGLYEICSRVSCWCCPMARLENLKKMWKHCPDLWQQLKDMDNRARTQFHLRYSVEDLEMRFRFEEERIAQGLSITNRDFHQQLRAKGWGNNESIPAPD